MSVDAVSLIMHEVVSQNQSRGMAIVSNSVRDSYGHRVIGMLPKPDASEATFGWYGQKMTIKPVTRDTVDINVQNSLDGLPAIHLGLRDTGLLGAFKLPGNVDDWIIILTFYRVE